MTKSKKAFGLIEAVIASGIIVLVAASAVGLASIVVKKTALFDYQIIANSYASEAIETAHLLRNVAISDSNPNTDWQTYLINTHPLSGAPSPLLCTDINPTNLMTAGNACGLTGIVRSGGSIDNDILFVSGGALTNAYKGAGFRDLSGGASFDVLNVDSKQLKRRIFINQDPTNPDQVEMRVVVFGNTDGSGDRILADISTRITNWKESL